MHRDRYVFLINKHARAIACLYCAGDEHNSQNKRTLFKTLDSAIKKDDLVIVPTNTRHGFTVVKVVEVDADIDVKSDEPLAWIAGVFDKPAFDRLLSDEQAAMAKIRSAELRKEREELRKNMLGMAADELGTLAIADLNGKTAESQ